MINEVFGIPIKYENWNKQGSLPLYIAAGYNFQIAYLNPPRVKTYEVYDKELDKAELEEELINPENQVKVEIWNYDPSHFSNSNMVDSISLALSFHENTDERIEEAVEELMKKERDKQ